MDAFMLYHFRLRAFTHKVDIDIGYTGDSSSLEASHARIGQDIDDLIRGLRRTGDRRFRFLRLSDFPIVLGGFVRTHSIGEIGYLHSLQKGHSFGHGSHSRMHRRGLILSLDYKDFYFFDKWYLYSIFYIQPRA